MKKTSLLACVSVVVLAASGPAFAASKKAVDCGHQAAIVAAVQKARLDRVKEPKVAETILAGEVSWPEKYNATIPIFAGEIYKLKMRDLKKTDVAAQWKTVCLAN